MSKQNLSIIIEIIINPKKGGSFA